MVFQEVKLNYEREYKIPSTGNFIDFLVEGSIVIKVKAKDNIQRMDYYQIQQYLHECGKPLGLIVNFRQQHLKPKRIALSIKTD